MKSLFGNVWTKRVISLLSVVYTLFVFRLCYLSIFYDMHIHQRASLCLAVSGVSLAALIIMLYTRHQIVTRICSFLILPAMLPVVLLYFGEWGLIIPIVITGIVILLMSGAGEGVKTALATIILLMYIFGALGYFLFSSFFVAAIKEKTVETGVSPSGEYRYRIVNTEDSSKGSTAIYVEPNTADVKNSFATFTLKNLERVVYLSRPIRSGITVNWETKSRQAITDELNALSDTIELKVTDEELTRLGYTYDNKLMLTDLSASRKFAIDKTAADVDPVALDSLTEDQLDFFGIGKEANGRYYIKSPSEKVLAEMEYTADKRMYINEMNAGALRQFNSEQVDEATGISYFTLKKYHNVNLNTLTDEQLDYLGVSPSGDVMTISIPPLMSEPDEEHPDAEPVELAPAEEKIVFRYYVAEIEDYYDVNSRHLSFDLLS